jgi:hypothetical protein
MARPQRQLVRLGLGQIDAGFLGVGDEDRRFDDARQDRLEIGQGGDGPADFAEQADFLRAAPGLLAGGLQAATSICVLVSAERDSANSKTAWQRSTGR